MFKVLPYKAGSQSAKALAESLSGLRLSTTSTKPFTPRESNVIINWGMSTRPARFTGVKMLNDPEVIRKVTDKLEFFKMMDGSDLTPRYWTDTDGSWDDDFPIVARTILNGHSGAGIVIIDSKDRMIEAPLYVEYIKKQQEYRVHVGMKLGVPTTIALQRKARMKSVPDSEVNWNVRSHQNGFVFARNNITVPDRVVESAHKALEISGLDFGAVDVIDNEKKKRSYVLEINSAPGLEGSTVTDYKNYFESLA